MILGLCGGFGKHEQSSSDIHILKCWKAGFVMFDLEQNIHDAETFDGFEKREQTYRHTKLMFYKYR